MTNENEHDRRMEREDLERAEVRVEEAWVEIDDLDQLERVTGGAFWSGAWD